MAHFRRDTRLPVSATEAFAWHGRPGAFERLTPPFQEIHMLGRTGGLEPGGRLEFVVRKGPLSFRWLSGHADYEEGRLFTDFQEEGPFAAWHHTHTFRPEGHGDCILEDRIDYRLPLGALGEAFVGRAIARDLARTFEHRSRRLTADLARHAAFAGRPPLQVAVTGAGGLVGAALVPFLTTGGHRVDALVRRAPRPETTEVRWDPTDAALDLSPLEGVDAVVHLAGENLAGHRWTEPFKAEVLRSRTEGTRNLCAALARLKHPPKSLVCASAIGYFGDRGEEVLTEESAIGTGFLPEVCRAWESACDPARKARIRVVNLRIGVVLSARGGALQRMLTPFRLGLGGRVGSGLQWVSWIALDDLVFAIHRALMDSTLVGPVNAVAPESVRQSDLARTLGHVLHRPTFAPLPAVMVRAFFGEMGRALLLESARVLPTRLGAAGFSFLYPDLESALHTELGRRDT